MLVSPLLEMKPLAPSIAAEITTSPLSPISTSCVSLLIKQQPTTMEEYRRNFYLCPSLSVLLPQRWSQQHGSVMAASYVLCPPVSYGQLWVGKAKQS
nr:hypothetical protein Iba_chr07dCG7210 [Ipomoea batatas]